MHGQLLSLPANKALFNTCNHVLNNADILHVLVKKRGERDNREDKQGVISFLTAHSSFLKSAYQTPNIFFVYKDKSFPFFSIHFKRHSLLNSSQFQYRIGNALLVYHACFSKNPMVMRVPEKTETEVNNCKTKRTRT